MSHNVKIISVTNLFENICAVLDFHRAHKFTWSTNELAQYIVVNIVMSFRDYHMELFIWKADQYGQGQAWKARIYSI